MSLTALRDRVYCDGVIPSGRNFFLLMLHRHTRKQLILIVNFMLAYHPLPTQSLWIVLNMTCVNNGSGLGLRVRVRIQNKPLPNWPSRLSTYPNLELQYVLMVNPPTHSNLAGCDRVAQYVDLYVHIKLLVWQYVNSILTQSHFHHPIMHFCMLCNLQYRFIWNPCFTFDILFWSLSRWSIILLYA
jgi:hypothetical protein